MSTTFLRVKDSATLVRKTLKQKFPGTKFSVRSHSYSGGASIDVDWTDGPTTAMVKVICELHEGADFDGMQDLKTNKPVYYSKEDGTVEKVQPLVDFIFANRRYSPEAFDFAVRQVCQFWGIPNPPVKVDPYGNPYLDTADDIILEKARERLGTLVWRELTKTDLRI